MKCSRRSLPNNRLPSRISTPTGRMRLIWLAALLTTFSPACRETKTLQPGPLTPFEQWQSLNLHNYTIDQQRSCYCPYAGELMRVTVRADTVARVLRISDSTVVVSPVCISVGSLFEIVRNCQCDSLVVRYHAQYGYPEYLDVDPQLHPVDGGYLYTTSNLRIP